MKWLFFLRKNAKKVRLGNYVQVFSARDALYVFSKLKYAGDFLKLLIPNQDLVAREGDIFPTRYKYN